MPRSSRFRFLAISAALLSGLALLLWSGRSRLEVSPALASGDQVEVRPARVKPGDPEIRLSAAPGVVGVQAVFPFDLVPRQAVLDQGSATWAVRFLVPPEVADGRYLARLFLVHSDGSREERQTSIHVDTRAPPVAVLNTWAGAEPGHTLSLRLQPGLPLATLATAWSHPGNAVEVMKSAVETKEILVRAPWGEVSRARAEQSFAGWTADLHVPADAPPGAARIEVVGVDAAGNASHRFEDVRIGPPPLPGWITAVALALLLAFGAGMAAVLRTPTLPVKV
jgi:hypothetical protein